MKKNVNSNRQDLLEDILTDIDREMDDKEIIKLLTKEKIARNPDDEQLNFGARVADKIAGFVGSWTFILSFVAVLLFWMLLNAVFLANKSFDPYPFILLNLVLSCVAAIQAPLIMMSQNRQEKKDRLQNENAYRVNLKSEIVMGEILTKLEIMAAEQDEIDRKLEELLNK